ncbi:MAG: hypothetical protein L0220_03565, partial [Acidobacteria bacterium]|nr:hypothetical protein [Acidobacteriota bacterium]
ITISRSDGGVTTGTTQIAELSPGLFTANSNGQGAAAALVLRIKADGTQRYESAAHFDPGQNKFVTTPIDLGDETDQVFLILFGTGFGAMSSTTAVNVKLGGVNVPVLFAGPQGDYAGLNQLNLSLSRSLAGLGEVDVTLTVDNETTNKVRVRIE